MSEDCNSGWNGNACGLLGLGSVNRYLTKVTYSNAPISIAFVVTSKAIDDTTGTLSITTNSLSNPICTITSGQNSCNMSINWSTANSEYGSSVYLTKNNDEVNPIAGGLNGGISTYFDYGQTSIKLRYKNSIKTYSLAEKSVNVICASGSKWDSGTKKCVTPPGPKVTVEPKAYEADGVTPLSNNTIQTNGTVVIGWDAVGATKGCSCMTNYNQDCFSVANPKFISKIILKNQFTITNFTQNTTFKFSCK